MTADTNPATPAGAPCLVCGTPRLPDPMPDGIAHAQCDQKLAALDPEHDGQPRFTAAFRAAAPRGPIA